MRSPSKATSVLLLPLRVRRHRAEHRRAAADAEAVAARVAKEEASRRARAERTAARRRALLESDRELCSVERDGHTFYGRQVTSFSASQASAHNLELITDILSQTGIEYFLVPGRSALRHVVGVHFDDRKRLLEALRAAYGNTALYAVRPSTDPLPNEAALYADGALPKDLKGQGTIRFGELLLGPAGQLLADLVSVATWSSGVTAPP